MDDEEEYLLKDIAFDMWQIKNITRIREGLIFSSTGKLLTRSLKKLNENKQRLINEYQANYKKAPDIEVAKRIFARDAQTDGIAWREAGNVNN